MTICRTYPTHRPRAVRVLLGAALFLAAVGFSSTVIVRVLAS